MNIFARILSHSFALIVVIILALGYIYRGELFPDINFPGFLATDSSQGDEIDAATGVVKRDEQAEDADVEVGQTAETVSQDEQAPDSDSAESAGAESTSTPLLADTQQDAVVGEQPVLAADIPDLTSPVPAEPARMPATGLVEKTVAEAEAEAAPVTDITIGRETITATVPDAAPATDTTTGPATITATVPDAAPATDTATAVTTPPLEAVELVEESVKDAAGALPAGAAAVDAASQAADEAADAVEAVEESSTTVAEDEVQPEPAGVVVAPPVTQDGVAAAPEAVVPPAATGESPYRLLADAREAYWLRDYATAEQKYYALINLDPANPDSFGELGNMYFSQGRWALASAAYFEAGKRLADEGLMEEARRLVDVLKGMQGGHAQQLERYIASKLPAGQ